MGKGATFYDFAWRQDQFNTNEASIICAGIPAQYPRIQGQYTEYIEAQLKAFRDGTRANDPAKMMRTIAIKMTDPEIKAVSDYIAGLR